MAIRSPEYILLDNRGGEELERLKANIGGKYLAANQVLFNVTSDVPSKHKPTFAH